MWRLLGVTALTGHRNVSVTLLLYLLVATQTGCFGLLGMEGGVERVVALLARLIVTTGSAALLYFTLSIPGMVTSHAVDLGRAMLVVGKINQCLAGLYVFGRSELEVDGCVKSGPGKRTVEHKDTQSQNSHNGTMHGIPPMFLVFTLGMARDMPYVELSEMVE